MRHDYERAGYALSAVFRQWFRDCGSNAAKLSSRTVRSAFCSSASPIDPAALALLQAQLIDLHQGFVRVSGGEADSVALEQIAGISVDSASDGILGSIPG